ncbi:ORF-113 [Buzura suppressaria nucleopolyhedrovirus]|uniref:ORF-113 n=1 Tax=Buzura suppressaria nuclear polyhedrosis virus TaxID=74320 RepID=W5VSE3_NPVBS|nr:ORF-113 [Buzura suppressaria nucleopolyhedrovirus]AHH82702.1 ORF-113 [Buzura suppressaria nucleopolyhedrovirus]AKN91086.1 ORF-116 [Buzura suppressaria nucleopolyhedrovirus]
METVADLVQESIYLAEQFATVKLYSRATASFKLAMYFLKNVESDTKSDLILYCENRIDALQHEKTTNKCKLKKVVKVK